MNHTNPLNWLGIGILALTIMVYWWHWLLVVLVLALIIHTFFKVFRQLRQRGFNEIQAAVWVLLITLNGAGIGFAFLKAPELLAISGFPLIGMMAYPKIHHRRLTANYHRSAPQRIQP